MDFRPLRVHAEDKQPPLIPNGLSAVIAVGEVSGFVVSWLERKPAMANAIRRFGPALVPIWPPTRELAVWPPIGGSMDHERLDALADSVVRMDDVSAGRARPNA